MMTSAERNDTEKFVPNLNQLPRQIMQALFMTHNNTDNTVRASRMTARAKLVSAGGGQSGLILRFYMRQRETTTDKAWH